MLYQEGIGQTKVQRWESAKRCSQDEAKCDTKWAVKKIWRKTCEVMAVMLSHFFSTRKPWRVFKDVMYVQLYACVYVRDDDDDDCSCRQPKEGKGS